MFTLDQASRLYGVPLIDYERPNARGLLVSSGSGIMLSVMDKVPSLRWCVDIDGLSASARLGDFMLMADMLVARIAVCGWFSLTDPTPLRDAVRALPRKPIVYAGHIRLGAGDEVQTLADFIDVLNWPGVASESRTG
jgi:hypothetical protein